MPEQVEITEHGEGGEHDGPEFVKYLVEREEAKERLLKKEKELQYARSRNYELMEKCDELEMRVSVANINN